MKYLKFDLGLRARGDVAVVTLSGDNVNVQLMKTSSLAAYKAGRGGYPCWGGHVTKSPFHVVVSHDGHWVVTIDRGGYAVGSRASVR